MDEEVDVQEFVTMNELKLAYDVCLKNKKDKLSAIEVVNDSFTILSKLWYDLNYNQYKIGTSTAFVVDKPVYREVFAANFVDRIVHHLVVNELNPYFEQTFISSSFSCRDGKGALDGVMTADEYIKKCTNNYTLKDCYVLKMDIKSFFMTIDKEILLSLIKKVIKENYNDTKERKRRGNFYYRLCHQIVMHRPELDCIIKTPLWKWNNIEKGKSLVDTQGKTGMPIGNLTSQVFANVYLNELDHFVTETLGFEYYIRYVDDFLIVSNDKEKLKDSIEKIELFLSEKLHLKLHPRKRYLQHYTKGVKIIGGLIKKGRKYIGNRTVHNLRAKLIKDFNKPDENKVDDLVCSVNSYLGFMIHYCTFNIRKSLFEKGTILSKWEEVGLITHSEEYNKIINIKKQEEKKKKKRQARKKKRMREFSLKEIHLKDIKVSLADR